jgi:hypothetical protein
MSTMHIRSTLLALLLATPGLAQAVPEVEANHPIAVGQTIAITAESGQTTGGATIDGVVGALSGGAVQDLDYFVFSGQEGDVVTLDIDMGMGGLRSVDTIIAVFGAAPGYPLLRMNDDGGAPPDAGSISGFDSRIVNFRLPADGAYTVGVSSFPRRFVAGGGTSTSNLGANPNGDYTLLISGVSASMLLQINIDIKPGSGSVAPINPKARGRIPVALLGASDFSVEDVDTGSLTFGHFGNEASLAKCGNPGDVNGDTFPDLVCHFENQTAKFDSSDEEAILRGELDDGRQFEGRGWLKVVPVKAQY